MKELSKKEKRQIKKADNLRVILNIINFTLGRKISWKKLSCTQAHCEFYRGNATILGIPVIIECAQWSALRYLNVYYEEEIWSTLCPRKYKPNFRYMLSIIEENITQNPLKKSDEDTTMILPFCPEKKAVKSTDREKLQEVINFLTTP